MSSSPMISEISNLDQRVPVVLVMGQSNAVGVGIEANAPDDPLPNTWLYEGSRPESAHWLGVKNGATFGPEWGAANEYAPAAYIKHAIVDTNLYEQWAPGGPRYEDAVDTVWEALAELEECGNSWVIKALIWVQGEADGGTSEAVASAWSANMDVMVSSIRAEFGTEFKIIVVEIIDPRGWCDIIRAQQIAFVAGDSNAAFIPTGDLTATDGVHFDTESTFTIGERCAEEIP